MKTLLVPADVERNIQYRTFPAGVIKDPLPQVREVIGGWAEMLNFVNPKTGQAVPDLCLLVDEDAKLKRPLPPVNTRASIFAGLLTNGRIILGDALVLARSRDEDSFKSLTVPHSVTWFEDLYDYAVWSVVAY